MFLKSNPNTTQQRSQVLPPPPVSAIEKALSQGPLELVWLAGDGSDRCYYRIRSLHSSKTWALMQLSEKDARELAKNNYEWIHISQLLQNYGLHVPRLICTMPSYHALIIEDLGDTLLEKKWLQHQKKGLLFWQKEFEPVVQMIERMQKIKELGASQWQSRIFDYEKYMWEMEFFQKQMQKYQVLSFSSTEEKHFKEESHRLCQLLEKYSSVFTHRDFHSRNIVCWDRKLYLIDFQDARLGSKVYDLASIVFDNYFDMPASTRHEVYQHFLNKKPFLKIDFEEAFLVLLQRQLKAAASYVFLTCEKKRGLYLHYIDPVIQSLDHPNIRKIEHFPFLTDHLVQKMKAVGKTISEKMDG